MNAPTVTTDPGLMTREGSRRAFATAIWAQCFGIQPQLALGRGLGLLYLGSLGLPGPQILVLLSLPLLVRGVLSIPMGFLADRLGKKRVGAGGQILAAGGFGLLAGAGWAPEGSAVWFVISVGLVLFGAGTAMFGAGWFSLLSPLMPSESRARSLGRLRFARQLAAVAFGALLAPFLSSSTTVPAFQLMFAILTVFLWIRWLLYRTIPEVEDTGSSRGGILESMAEVLRIPGYRRFGSYVLASFLTIGAVPMIFGLLGRDVLALGDDQIWQFGVAMIAGHLLGSWVAGRLGDELGSRPMLALCQAGFLFGMGLFVLRGHVAVVLLASMLFGMARSALQVSVTSELLRTVPRTNKSLAIAGCTTLIHVGESLSGLLIAGLLSLGVLASEKAGELASVSPGMSTYDIILLGLCASLIALLAALPWVILRDRTE